jgi:predicted permease
MERTDFITEPREDVGYAFRTLRRSPGFTAVALLTLALGIGANSAIFSVVHGVLLESLPFRDAQQLYQVRMLYPDGTIYSSISAPDFMNVREENRVFEQVEAYDVRLMSMLGAGEPREVNGATVTVGLFDLLGVPVSLGRGFVPEENQRGRGAVVILDRGFWERVFGANPNVLGQSIAIAGRSYSIVGVLARGAGLPDSADIYLPIEYDDTYSSSATNGRRSESLSVLGRARPGVRIEAIDGDLKRIGTRLQTAFPASNARLTFATSPLAEMIVGDVRRPLLMLLGAVALVLLVACSNVANLLLARGSARHGELAVRAALGAGRARLLRQLVTEAVVLGISGAALGLLLAYWATEALIAARPADIPRLEEVGVDGTVVLFTLGIALATSIVFGMVPALQATNANLTRGLQEGGRSGAGGRGTYRTRAALVVAEMALAVVLLIGSGLLIRSFIELTRVDPGFEPSGAVSVRLSLQGELYQNGDQIRARVAELEERLRGLQGVTAVASASALPFSGGALWDFVVEGAPPPPPDVNQEILIALVTPDYFRAIGAPLKRGRFFDVRDSATGPPVGLLNDAAVKRWFNGEDPIGKRVISGGRPLEIVGIVGDVLQRNPGRPAMPQLFIPHAQRTSRTVNVVVRGSGDPLSRVAAIRDQIRAIDPNLPIGAFARLDEIVARSVARPRFYTSLLTLFAAVALALAATGIFGVMSYTVAQRAREISIRMALGARTIDVLRSVVGHALVLAGIGVVLGIAGAAAFGRVIQNQLFGVSLFDPLTFFSVVSVLLGSAALASLLPARRAAGVDPATAFRQS